MFKISKTRSSLASFKMAFSPIFLLVSNFTIGEIKEILPLAISASSTPTI
tara:strand:+ start:277 stop:426 length:150 start_codon:yes stop_codon:yes gene_type:complete